MKHIVLFCLSGLLFFSCDNSNTDKKEAEQKEVSKKEIKKQLVFKSEEIGDSSLIFGEWKIVGIGGKAVPEDRKDITATFKPDGAFERRLSATHKPDIGTWSIVNIDSIKVLKLYTAAGKEDNQLIKLTKDELVFINFRKPVRLKKVK
jgi:hypothetical protein